MGKTIGIISIKGGVGKTTIAASMAADLVNYYGKKVMLVDANYSAPNLGLHMDIIEPGKTIHDVLSGRARVESAIHKRFGVDVVPGSYVYSKDLNLLKLKDKLAKAKNEYDFIIIDSSPSLNDEVLSAMLASDHLFVVTTPDYPTLSCSLKAAKLARQRGKNVSGVIINKIRDPKYEVDLDNIEASLGIPVVAKIADDKNSVRALFNKTPVSVYNNKSAFAKEINKLNAALTYHVEPVPLWRYLFGKNFKREEVNRSLLKEGFYTSLFSNNGRR
ncbi:MinD/ParA family protein [Candidatus Pacearchaeota archaeon]|nr:MinD/ParA family protein [Candidatus Pacearchaeota archaeon]